MKQQTIADVRERLRKGYSGKTAASKMRGMACDIMFLLRELDKVAADGPPVCGLTGLSPDVCGCEECAR